MGFKKPCDVADIASRLHALSRECSSPLNDGFTAFELKKDLYLLKEVIDSALQSAPSFGHLEEEWLTEREKKRIIKILKS